MSSLGDDLLHANKVYGVHRSPIIVRIMASRRLRWSGNVACIEEKRNACKMVVGKPHGKCPFEGPWKGLERNNNNNNNNNVGLREIGFHGRRSLNLDQGLVSWLALELADVEL